MKMPMSGAYQRGFKHALKAAADIAERRKAACEAASEIHRGAGSDDHGRELCAAREAGLIAERILQLEPTQLDRRFVILKGRRSAVPR
jgi:hypothetical protein